MLNCCYIILSRELGKIWFSVPVGAWQSDHKAQDRASNTCMLALWVLSRTDSSSHWLSGWPDQCSRGYHFAIEPLAVSAAPGAEVD
jgi:hypothetical protein